MQIKMDMRKPSLKRPYYNMHVNAGLLTYLFKKSMYTATSIVYFRSTVYNYGICDEHISYCHDKVSLLTSTRCTVASRCKRMEHLTAVKLMHLSI